VRYKVTQRDIEKFQGNFIQIMEQHLCGTSNAVGGAEEGTGQPVNRNSCPNSGICSVLSWNQLTLNSYNRVFYRNE
jgi:hypothetical protein